MITKRTLSADRSQYSVKRKTNRNNANQATNDFCFLDKGCTDLIIVLNLLVEYNPKIIIDSFTISIYTAILLKILLEVILKLEHRVSDVFRSYKVLRILLVWLILFGSKFLILEVVDVVFGDHVELGKFLDVILLVIALMVVKEVFQRIYLSLGHSERE